MPAKIYDWEELFAQGQFTLIQGLDYSCATTSMAQQIRNAASARGLRVAIVERGLILLVLVRTGPKGTRREQCLLP